MTKASDNVFPRLLISEGGSTATPPAAEVTAYAKADGLLYSKDDAGVEKLLSSGPAGSVATDAIWDTKGDLAAATGADAAAKLAAAANGSFLRTASGQSTGLEWQLNNLAAAVAPTVNEDSGDGYSIGSRWIDTTADKEYVCLDASVGAAVWTETTGGGGGGNTSGQFIAGFDAGDFLLTAGKQQDIIAPFTGTITSWTILADETGSAVVDVWVDTYANYPPTVGDSITAAAKPTLSGSNKATSSTLTGWSTAVVAGDVLRINLDSVSGLGRLLLVLAYSRP